MNIIDTETTATREQAEMVDFGFSPVTVVSVS